MFLATVRTLFFIKQLSAEISDFLPKSSNADQNKENVSPRPSSLNRVSRFGKRKEQSKRNKTFFSTQELLKARTVEKTSLFTPSPEVRKKKVRKENCLAEKLEAGKLFSQSSESSQNVSELSYFSSQSSEAPKISRLENEENEPVREPVTKYFKTERMIIFGHGICINANYVNNYSGCYPMLPFAPYVTTFLGRSRGNIG